jgi:hypothetical protein
MPRVALQSAFIVAGESAYESVVISQLAVAIGRNPSRLGHIVGNVLVCCLDE